MKTLPHKKCQNPSNMLQMWMQKPSATCIQVKTELKGSTQLLEELQTAQKSCNYSLGREQLMQEIN